MLESVLIANRGEIACRIIRTAKRMGLRTIAVYSDADARAPHVRMADEAVWIGPAPALESYLSVERLLSAVRETDAQAVHPGYGFLSENAAFADACNAAGSVFIGPSGAAIRAMGSKIEAKRLVAAAGTPVVPGYQGDDQDAAVLAAEAEKIGYPLLVKASAGGGGKGMRLVEHTGTFEAALAGAKREAKSAFADDRVLLERYLTAPKHIEVQILGDSFGACLYLFERDCSVQRRHQKVIEEAPAPTVTPQMRRTMGEAAVRAAKAIDYTGAGTVEFIAQGDEFFFMEMNTRLQVEHPVTEMILGLDLVEWQIRIASGEPIGFTQEELRIDGHAIEARVYAENAKRNFLPSTGKLHRVSFPESVRVDTGVETGSEVSVHYDPMIAKVIAHGRDRHDAIIRLRDALTYSEVVGVEHNIAYLKNVLAHPDFVGGTYTTGIAVAHGDSLVPPDDAVATVLGALALTANEDHGDAWSGDGFQLNLPHMQKLALRRGRKRIELVLTKTPEGYRVDGPDGEFRVTDLEFDEGVITAHVGTVTAHVDGAFARVAVLRVLNDVHVVRGGAVERLQLDVLDAGAFAGAIAGTGGINAPMPSQVVNVAVKVGDKVKAGQVLVIVEAMKMEHSVTSPADGVVETIHFGVGDRVGEGAELVTLKGVSG